MMDPSMPLGRYLGRVVIMLDVQSSNHCGYDDKKWRNILERSPSNAGDLSGDRRSAGV